MTTDMKLKMLKSMTDEEDKDVLSTYLSLAEKVVLQRAWTDCPWVLRLTVVTSILSLQSMEWV